MFRRTPTTPEEFPVTEDPGTPLSEHVIQEIINEHRHRVPDSVAFPMPGLTPNSWAALPAVPKGYSASDGHYVGSPLAPEVAENARYLVVLRDDVLPTPDDLRRVRVGADGVVRWEP